MWADNEADLDLLGFDFLVDGLVVALTEPRLLPLTIGVLGDWGSGKSSLMRIAACELSTFGLKNGGDVRTDDLTAKDDGGEPVSPYLTVPFSPWQYEDHDDIKIALMTAVLDAIAKRAPGAAEQVGRLRRIVASLRRWGRRLGRTGIGAAPAVLPVFLQGAGLDLDPAVVEAATALTGVAAKQAETALKVPDDGSTPNAETPFGDVDAFRREFTELVTQIPDCRAVVVFIDDLDRCLPETVVETFEAIRLFLNTPKTAYVLALNQNVVESAIDSRYPALKKPDGAGIGRDYLEKMLQLKIAIPPLSAPEAETYVNLLFADLHLSDSDFEQVLKKASEVRRENGLAVAFNTGIAGVVLKDIPAELANDLKWAADISPILGASLRGNPRQLKRFLNNLLLKHRSAKRRGAKIELPVLAKLMVLEDQYNTDFQKLFDWEMSAGGACSELTTAEARAREGSNSPIAAENGATDSKQATGPAQTKKPVAESKSNADQSDAEIWADKTHIASWLRADPPFAGIDLRPYFTYSRDKLSFGVSASRLAPHLQRLITDVQSEIEGNRRSHYPTVAALDPSERMQFIEALLERVHRNPAATALTAALELAEKNSDIVGAVCAALLQLPPSSIPFAAGTAAVRRLPLDDPAVNQLLQRWEDGENTQLRTVVKSAREAAARANR